MNSHLDADDEQQHAARDPGQKRHRAIDDQRKINVANRTGGINPARRARGVLRRSIEPTRIASVLVLFRRPGVRKLQSSLPDDLVKCRYGATIARAIHLVVAGMQAPRVAAHRARDPRESARGKGNNRAHGF